VFFQTDYEEIKLNKISVTITITSPKNVTKITSQTASILSPSPPPKKNQDFWLRRGRHAPHGTM